MRRVSVVGTTGSGKTIFARDLACALDAVATQTIALEEFVPASAVDPLYVDKSYYLGPDKGGDKPYRLLCDAMVKTQRVALAKFVMRGKENLVLIRPSGDGLMLHAMYFADEVRDFSEIDKGKGASIKSGELDLALRLIGELTNANFEPEKYHDEYRGRVRAMIESKVEGNEITSIGPQAQHTQVRVLGTRELGEIIAAVLPVRLYRPYQQRLAAEEMDP